MGHFDTDMTVVAGALRRLLEVATCHRHWIDKVAFFESLLCLLDAGVIPLISYADVLTHSVPVPLIDLQR